MTGIKTQVDNPGPGCIAGQRKIELSGQTIANIDPVIIGSYNTACLITLSGATAAVAAVFFASGGRIELALIALILAGIADLFDGFVARRLQRNAYEKAYGVQLDTVVDVVAFVVAPVVIALNSGADSLPALGGLLLFALAGIVRLAHFNTLSIQGTDQSDCHRGLPVTYTALVLPLLFVTRDFVSPSFFQTVLGTVFPLLGLLFVLDLPVKKPRGVFYLIFPLLAVALVGYWAFRADLLR